MSDDELRETAMSQVLEDHPELANPADSESLARLNVLVDEAVQQLRTRIELEDAQRRKFAEQARADGERAKKERAEAQLQAEREREQANEAQKVAALAAMNPLPTSILGWSDTFFRRGTCPLRRRSSQVRKVC